MIQNQQQELENYGQKEFQKGLDRLYGIKQQEIESGLLKNYLTLW